MYPQRKFRSHEDEDEQVLYRPILVEGAPNFRIPVAQLIIFSFICAYLALFLNALLHGWMNPYSASPEAVSENFLFAKGFTEQSKVVASSGWGISSGHLFLGSLFSAWLESVPWATHAISLIQILTLMIPLAAVIFNRAGLVPVSFTLGWLVFEESVIRTSLLGVDAGWAVSLVATYLAANLYGSRRISSVIVLVSVFFAPIITLFLAAIQILRFMGLFLTRSSEPRLGDLKFEMLTFSSGLLILGCVLQVDPILSVGAAQLIIMILSLMVATFIPLLTWEIVRNKKGASLLGANVKGTLVLTVVGALILTVAPKTSFLPRSPLYDVSDSQVWSFIQSNITREELLGGPKDTLVLARYFGERSTALDSLKLNLARGREINSKQVEAQLLRANYASDVRSFLSEVDSLGVSYFLYDVGYFSGDLLESSTSLPVRQLLFARIKEASDAARYPFLKYRDSRHVLISIQALRDFLKSGGRLPWPKP